MPKVKKEKEVKKSKEIKNFKVEDVTDKFTPAQVEAMVAKISVPTPIPIDTPKIEFPPLQAGQKYFQAPDGTIVIGSKDVNEVWYRKGNNGKGCWVNPYRDGTQR